MSESEVSLPSPDDRGSDELAWRPGVLLLVVSALAVAAAVGVVVSERVHIQGYDSAVRSLRRERAGGKVRERDMARHLERSSTAFKSADLDARRIEKKVGPMQAHLRSASADLKRVNADARGLRSVLNSWITVPDVSGIDETEATTLLTEDGLGYTVAQIDGTCADYQGHFIDRGLGWSDTIKQSPAAGYRVPSDTQVAVYVWDYGSNWEIDCVSADY